MSDGLRRRAGPDEDGRRLDAVLSEWLDTSRAQAQRRLTDGRVRVDGLPARKSHQLAEGELVEVAASEAVARGRPPEVPVRWADDDVAVVAKPPGLVVHTAPGLDPAEPTLVDALHAQGLRLAAGGGPDRPGIVHRLDRNTSGLLVVALDDSALWALRGQLAERLVLREYWALVEGRPGERLTIDAPLGRHPVDRGKFVVRSDGREAVTHLDRLATLAGVSAVRLRLQTGRTHQVRVHLGSIGHPVAGDVAYGADPARAERLGLARQALHAHRIAFDHPLRPGVRVDVREPLPADLERARSLAADGGAEGAPPADGPGDAAPDRRG